MYTTDFYALQTWLVERALEHDQPMLLLQLACDELRRQHIVRPGLTRLERLGPGVVKVEILAK